jgi:hypothetical protein
MDWARQRPMVTSRNLRNASDRSPWVFSLANWKRPFRDLDERNEMKNVDTRVN